MYTRNTFKKRTNVRYNDDVDNEDEEETIDERIEVLHNSIYFYTEITGDTAFKLRIELQKLITKHLTMNITHKLSEPMPIYLHINSPGGELHHALAIVDVILGSKIPIYTVIEGEAVSAATLISVVGHKRYINKNAHMLIHQLSSGCWGKMMELEDEIKNLKIYNNKLINIYKNYTNLKTTELKNILKKDISWTSQVCLKYGLVDEIL